MWTPVPDPDENAKNSLGLKIIFVVLLLTLIAELTYFFYIVPNKKVATNVTPTLTPTSTPTKITTSIPAPKEYKGKIVKIEIGKSQLPYDNNKPELIISLENEVGGVIAIKKFSFALNKEDFKKIKVVSPLGKIIPFKDIKIGENVKITEIYDLKKKIYSSDIIAIIN